MADLDDIREKLKAIAETVNAFKSEAVQLRIVEVLLAQLGATDTSETRVVPKAKRAKRTPKSKGHKAASNDGAPAAVKTAKRSRSSGSPGAFATISDLVETGFFKTPRTIKAIIEHAGDARGHHYKPNECSPALLRLLRDGKLTRKKNSDGQYEYTKA